MRRLIAVLLVLSGCELYWNQGDDNPCNYDYGATGGAAQSAFELRNPVTGLCEYGGGGGYPCNSQCGPCAEAGGDRGAAVPQVDWGSCYSQCDGLTESACLTAAGCYAAYDEDRSLADAPAKTTFKGCWDTAPSGPVSTGTCWNLDAHECSRHDNCSAYYDASSKASRFTRCATETSANGCTGIDCGPGYHCQDECKDTGGGAGTQCASMCFPDGSTCTTAMCGAGYECVETCIDMTPTHVGQCYPSCVPKTACAALPTEAACLSRTDCTGVYDGQDCTCYPNSGCTCEILTYDHCASH